MPPRILLFQRNSIQTKTLQRVRSAGTRKYFRCVKLKPKRIKASSLQKLLLNNEKSRAIGTFSSVHADESRMSMTGEAFLSRPHYSNEREFKTKLRRTPRAVCVRRELEIGVILAGYSPETALNVPNGGILASISPETTVLTLKTQIVYLDDIVTQLFAQHSFVCTNEHNGGN